MIDVRAEVRILLSLCALQVMDIRFRRKFSLTTFELFPSMENLSKRVDPWRSAGKNFATRHFLAVRFSFPSAREPELPDVYPEEISSGSLCPLKAEI